MRKEPLHRPVRGGSQVAQESASPPCLWLLPTFPGPIAAWLTGRNGCPVLYLVFVSMKLGVGKGRFHETMKLRCLSSLEKKWVGVHTVFKFRIWVRASGGGPLLLRVGSAGREARDYQAGSGFRESLSGLRTLIVEHPAVTLLVLREFQARGSQGDAFPPALSQDPV